MTHESFKKIKHIFNYDDYLEIITDENNSTVKLNYFWLRENCRCEKCFNNTTNQRHLTIIDLPDEVKPESCSFNNGNLRIAWNDKHDSVYSLDWIIKYSQPEILPDPILWSGKLSEATTIACNDLNSETKVADLIRSLIVYGVGFVNGLEPTIEATEKVVTSMFPVQRTFFGDMWTVEKYLTFLDTAYTNEFIGAHTDNTYFNDAAGLQIFHVMKFDGEGGKTLLVDGFRAVADVEKVNPDYVQCLRNVKVESYYSDDTRFITNVDSILKYSPNNRLNQIRYNLYDRSPRMVALPAEQQGLFYSALRCLAGCIGRGEGEWWLRLQPGTAVFINNWRVMHGRASYQGSRVLGGCYVSMADFLSKARMLKVIV
ncbi:trimethyllysine dioxygenase, mitochondrial isoform X2 [Nilaparvata lugens]|uniref:trimethyllysine dioxygenase, mitochondrial isoform X2 n=1 Tax=Nilaparvata lugens TaxID=108931 RepID=UPI00193D3FA4|nr:trimethyllysine dioxygenase, mitochondrial isoform X2 [Nilaparvata lugens]